METATVPATAATMFDLDSWTWEEGVTPFSHWTWPVFGSIGYLCLIFLIVVCKTTLSTISIVLNATPNNVDYSANHSL